MPMLYVSIKHITLFTTCPRIHRTEKTFCPAYTVLVDCSTYLLFESTATAVLLNKNCFEQRKDERMPDTMQNYLTKMLEHCSLSFLKASPWQAKNWEINSFSKFCLRNFKFTPISQYIDRCQTCQGIYRTYLVIRLLSYLIKNAVGGRRKAEKSWKSPQNFYFRFFSSGALVPQLLLIFALKTHCVPCRRP